MTSDFLVAVLGPSGAAAITPVVEASPTLASYIPVRSALAWVAATESHRGVVPGTSIPFGLEKSEVGWTGVIGAGSSAYAFSSASAAHVAAAMTTYLGATPGKLDLRDIDLARLAKTIDALVKSKKGKASTPGTGLHAAPIAPEPPIAPTPVAPTMPKPDAAKKPKVEKPKTKAEKPKLPKLRLSISDSFKTCSVCRAKNISGVDFVGCHCFKALAKQVSVEVMNWGSGFELSFGPDWDQDAVETLQECFNG